MTIQTTTNLTYRPQLRALSSVLRDVHRSLIDFSRERYELANGAVGTRAELLGLLLDDDAFTWLRSLSGLIVEIDEVATSSSMNQPGATEMGGRVAAFIAPSDDPNAFGSRYTSLLASEPRVAMHHGELLAAVRALTAEAIVAAE